MLKFADLSQDQMEAVNLVASIVHEANRQYCAAYGDDSQKPWSEAQGWQIDSSRESVLMLVDNPLSPASTSHEAWMASKLAAGWTHGDVKDDVEKTHPCLVPYDELPEMQRGKDRLVNGVVRSMLPMLKVVFPDLGTRAPNVDRLVESATHDVQCVGRKTVVATATLPCGFDVVAHSACHDSSNFKESDGRWACGMKLKRKLVELESYRLRCMLPDTDRE